MQQRLTITVIAGLAVMAVAMVQERSNQPDPAAQDNAERALRILRNACDQLAGAKTVRVSGEGSYDQIDEQGIRMELSARRMITLQRPDRLRVETEGDTGSRVVIFDHGRLGILSPAEKLYGLATLHPTLDEAIDQLADQYGMVLPTADLLLSDPYAALTGAVTLAAHLGEHKVGDQPCDHLAFQTENVDYQVWITKAQPPVIRKLVIAFKNEPGVPQFRAVFNTWEFTIEPEATTFEFQPPADFTKVEIQSDSTESEDGSDEG